MATRKRSRATRLSTPPSIRDILTERDLSQADVARGTNLSEAYISRLFRGEREPRISTTTTVASFLGLSVEQLMAAINT